MPMGDRRSDRLFMVGVSISENSPLLAFRSLVSLHPNRGTEVAF